MTTSPPQAHQAGQRTLKSDGRLMSPTSSSEASTTIARAMSPIANFGTDIRRPRSAGVGWSSAACRRHRPTRFYDLVQARLGRCPRNPRFRSMCRGGFRCSRTSRRRSHNRGGRCRRGSLRRRARCEGATGSVGFRRRGWSAGCGAAHQRPQRGGVQVGEVVEQVPEAGGDRVAAEALGVLDEAVG